jgi:S-adenosylmethionine:tRNA ribosyltransferase-isomerase
LAFHDSQGFLFGVAYGKTICYKISSFFEGMRTEEFDYSLPKDLIAQQPEKERPSSRLLALDRSDGGIRHLRFRDVTGCLREGDLLVINDTKVIPARVPARKKTGGRVDILLTEEIDPTTWSCLVTGLRKTSGAARVLVGAFEVLLTPGEPYWTLETTGDIDVARLMSDYGLMPLPPYVRREKDGRNLDDYEQYQTVYAKHAGSIAAPTAGLHFDEGLLREIKAIGVNVASVTLHIGIGTFFLLKSEHVEGHEMHKEFYTMSAPVMEAVRQTKKSGGRVVAVGTSAVRTLETAFGDDNGGRPSGSTGLFIYPGYRYRVVDALITNFHLPRSTPLLLVAAFAGKELIENAYREAVERRYRFYSYGDAMFIS